MPNSSLASVICIRVKNSAHTLNRRMLAHLLVIGTIMAASLGMQAKTYIFGRSDFAAGNFPTSIAVADINGDGLTDVMVTNSGDNTVSVLLRRSDGTFASQVTYGTGPEPVAVAVGDFNKDGNVDIAVTNGNCTPHKDGPICSPSTVSILLGNGDGTFQPHFDYGVGTLPSSLLAADLDGDGKLDLAVSNVSDSTVSILLGKGNGTFQPQVVYATTVQFSWASVVLGDFNGDGKLDLAVSCGAHVSVLPGNGDGTFKTHIDSGPGGTSLAAGDFNGDGKLDIVVATGADPAARGLSNVLLGNGDGTFVLTSQYPGGASLSVSDLNGDGNLDLVVAGAGNQVNLTSVLVMLGNGNGTFQDGVQYGTGNIPLGTVIADLNGDGTPDLAVADSGCSISVNPCTGQQVPAGTISVLLGFGDGTFVGKSDYAVGGGRPLAAADFNNDNHLDLATANQLDASVSVLIGNGEGTFQPQVSYPVGPLPVSVAAADLRNAGDLDLVTANGTCPNTPPCNPGTVSILLGNGNGMFQPHVDYGIGLVPYYVAVGDFNGDGRVDVAATNNGSSTVSILLGNGDGTLQSQISYSTAASPQQIAVGDFDQDGKLDLAVTASSVSVLLGNGDGTFKSHTDYPGGSGAIAAGDFNGDGKLDLATGGESTISILLGIGDGTFKAPVTYKTSIGLAVQYIAVTDFNQDGRLDLAVNTQSEASDIFLGNGDGTFQQPTQYLLANLLSMSLTVGDFNGDGSPDWAAGDAIGNTIGVMLSAAFKAVSPGSRDFGSQGVGSTSAPQTVTLSNPSNVKINIASITSTGNYSQTNNCGVSLNIGASCEVSVTFSPSATGLQSGTIAVTDNTRISPLAISLRGTGVNGPFLTPNPSRENFQPQAVGVSSNPAAIVLENTGNSSLNLTAVAITGTNSSDFGQTNNCIGSLAPAATCTVNVIFTPTAGGSRIASLSVSDDATGSPQKVALTGTGIGAIASLSSNTLSFPSQTIGTTSTAQLVTLTNTGTTALSITSIAASGDFAETHSCTVVSPGSTCQISVSFTPSTTGNRTGTLAISDNAPGSPQAITLSGTGSAAPDFTIEPSSGSPTSQTIKTGQTATFNLDIAASGTFTGTVTLSCAITPVVNPAPTCGLSSSSLQITGSGTQPVTVTVRTTAPVTSAGSFYLKYPSGLLPTVCALTLLGLAWLRVHNRKPSPVLLAPFAFLALVLVMSCGGSSSPHTTPGTPAGTYTATVTSSSGTLNHMTALQVIVQ